MVPDFKPFELNSSTDLDPLMNKVGDSGLVMLGEASHGTHEYYTWRSAISKRLIEEKGFSFIAVEGDWPDCYRINRYVKGYPDTENSIQEVLNHFDRWPTWMWANWEIASLAEWLKEYNSKIPMEDRIGFYGLDVYSLWESLHALVDYLEAEDPSLAKTVKKALNCFDPYQEEGQRYAEAAHYLSESCKTEVLSILTEIRSKVQTYTTDREAGLNTEQNALVTVNAEKYYRNMIGFNNESWNIRDTHMMETLDHLMRFHGEKGKGIVWEHNTHIGDARATDMKKVGMINIGQLAREKYGEENVFLVGFGSYEGFVIAGREWGAPMQEMEVPPAREGSIEEILHLKTAHKNKLLLFDRSDPDDLFNSSFPHRAIGVVYNPHKEKYGNYVSSFMSLRYDAFIFIDETTALHPIYNIPDGHKIPETYPFGL